MQRVRRPRPDIVTGVDHLPGAGRFDVDAVVAGAAGDRERRADRDRRQ